MNDQDLYKKNIESYAKFSQVFASSLDQASIEQYHWCFTHIGELNFFIESGENRLYYHSMDGAMDEVRTFMRPVHLNEISLLFLFGIGAGYHYTFLKPWLRENPQRQLVIIEDNMAPLKMFFHTKVAEEMLQDPQVYLIPFKKELYQETLNTLESFSKTAEARRSYFILLPLYGKWQKKRCLILRDMLFTSLFWMQTMQGERIFGSVNVEQNFFFNTAYYAEWLSVFSFRDCFEKVPVIIVGGGPSAAPHLAKIKEWKENCVVIAAGSGLNVCNFLGIDPHFVAALDPTDSQATRLLSSHGYASPMIFRSRLNRRGFFEYHGPKISFNSISNFEPGRWILKRLGVSSYKEKAGISSTTYALEIAKFLGCGPIYLLGVDLAYTKGERYPEGVFHHPCDAIEHEKKVSSLRKDVIYGENYLGKMVLTRKDWLIEAELIQNYLKEENLEIYTLSEEGLRIKGVPFIEKIKKEESGLNSLDLEGEIQSLCLAQFTEKKDNTAIDCIFEEYVEMLNSYAERIAPFIEDDQKEFGGKKKETDELLKQLREEELYIDLSSYVKGQVDRVQDKGKKLLQRFSDSFSEAEKNELSCLLDQVELKNVHKLCLHLKSLIGYCQTLSKESRTSWEDMEPRDNAWMEQPFDSSWKAGVLRISSPAQKTHEEPFVVQKTLSVNRWDIPQVPIEGNLEINRSFGEGFTHVFTVKKGKLHGPSRYYHKNKMLVENWYFEGKKEGMQTSYYPSGACRELLTYVKGKKEGECVIFYQTGIISSYLFYKKDLLSGICRLYYPSGKIKRILPFKEGHLHGEELGFYESSACKCAAHWKEGKPQGHCVYYYPSGSIMRKNIFAEGGSLLSCVEYTQEGKELIRVQEQAGDIGEQIKRRRIEEELSKMQEEISLLQGPRGPENELFIF